jgi:hypothetical protein
MTQDRFFKDPEATLFETNVLGRARRFRSKLNTVIPGMQLNFEDERLLVPVSYDIDT